MAAFFIAGGIGHFVIPGFYLDMMPPWIPAHVLMVQISGVAEIAGGLGILLPPTRRLAGMGLILLLIAVFPANLYMATSGAPLTHQPSWIPNPTTTARWVRLPIQLVFIFLVWWTTLSRPKKS
jgi:uncharacterized membrane protein